MRMMLMVIEESLILFSFVSNVKMQFVCFSGVNKGEREKDREKKKKKRTEGKMKMKGNSRKRRNPSNFVLGIFHFPFTQYPVALSVEESANNNNNSKTTLKTINSLYPLVVEEETWLL